MTLAQRAWSQRADMEQGGLLNYVHGGEYHAYNPDVIATLQAAVQSGDYVGLPGVRAPVNDRPAMVIARPAGREAAGAAAAARGGGVRRRPSCARFDSAGMCLGALSPEAHEALAIAMNRLGGRSNSGEGGEDPARYGTEQSVQDQAGGVGTLRRHRASTW